MTSLIAWVGVDSHGVSSLNFASDSRITWYDKVKVIDRPWDFGKKLFWSSSTPDILGFAGDSCIASNILGQFTDLLSIGAIPRTSSVPQYASEVLASIINSSLRDFPDRFRGNFTVLHGLRIGTGKTAEWYVYRLYCDGWTCSSPEALDLPTNSGVLVEAGTGRANIVEYQKVWKGSDIGGTSRAVYSAFCESISLGTDERTGGAPQFCRLLRINPAKPVGIIWKGEKYVAGVRIPPSVTPQVLEWFNDQFEVCDPSTMQLSYKSQRQPRPGGLVYAKDGA